MEDKDYMGLPKKFVDAYLESKIKNIEKVNQKLEDDYWNMKIDTNCNGILNQLDIDKKRFERYKSLTGPNKYMMETAEIITGTNITIRSCEKLDDFNICLASIKPCSFKNLKTYKKAMRIKMKPKNMVNRLKNKNKRNEFRRN